MAEIDDDQLDTLNAHAAAAASAAAAAEAAAEQLAQGVAKYRAAIASHNPDIPAEAITGDTFDAVDASAALARTIADAAVAAHTPANTPAPTPPAAPAVPAGGAATRDDPADTSAMSAHAKIQYGLEHRQRITGK
ncbi:MAG: hypothetical protein IVW53_14625 [Chloroflexi bacterium]|nr:hypothetical protein [Chloroflexota bacterium]